MGHGQNKGGRPALLTEAHVAALRGIVFEQPRSSLPEVTRELGERTGMNTDLTDVEWSLVADLFERDGLRGAPPRYDRRSVVNACAYLVRTGCAWRLLPKCFPPWKAVHKSFARWAAAGTFEAMHDRLRQQRRDRSGRNPDPLRPSSMRRAPAAPRRAGTQGSTPARRSRAASAIWWSIPSGWCSP